MLAAVFDGPGHLDVREVPEAHCPRGGVLLAVHACAVCGTDVRIVGHGHHKVRPPQVLGHEVVGTVLESDTDVREGARVTIAPAVGCGGCRWCKQGRPNRCPQLRTIGYEFPGAFAPVLAVPPEAVWQGSVCEVPEGLPDDVACLAEPLACCLNGQELVGVGPGDRVLIVGLGPIGWLHARLARARGAAEVLLVEKRDDRRSEAVAAGLGTPVEGDAEAIRAATGGEGADVAILAAPSLALQAVSLDWLAKGGRVSWFGGLPPNSERLELDSNQVHYRELLIVGAHGSTPAHNREALRLLAGGEVSADGIVTGRYPLERTAAAVAAMARGEGRKSVVVLAG